jgi:hypothetical protein
MGMDKEQFTRVVMLPQGDFAAFLRADAKTRADLLQKLFGTTRFEEIEDQLKEDLAAATRQLQDARAEAEHVLRRARDEMQRWPADAEVNGDRATAGSDGDASVAGDAAGDAHADAGATTPAMPEPPGPIWPQWRSSAACWRYGPPLLGKNTGSLPLPWSTWKLPGRTSSTAAPAGSPGSSLSATSRTMSAGTRRSHPCALRWPATGRPRR